MAKRSTESVVTIKDIANSCGVSISTVSNVLNGKKNKVSEEMAAKFRAEVERTGYRPNYLAKSLRAISTKTIGIIAEDLIVFSFFNYKIGVRTDIPLRVVVGIFKNQNMQST